MSVSLSNIYMSMILCFDCTLYMSNSLIISLDIYYFRKHSTFENQFDNDHNDVTDDNLIALSVQYSQFIIHHLR